MTTTTHKHRVGDLVALGSGEHPYEVLRLRTDDHPKLKGEIGYDVNQIRNGKRWGPIRLVRASKVRGSWGSS